MKYVFLIIVTYLFIFLEGCVPGESYTLKMTITPDQITELYTREDIEDASTIIRNRLTSFGIKDEDIVQEVLPDKINMSLNNIDTAQLEIIKAIITAKTDIGFWETFDNSEVLTFLLDVNKKTKELNLGEEFRPYDKTAADSAGIDELLIQMDDSSEIVAREKFELENPLFAILHPMVNSEGTALPSCLVGLSPAGDTAKVMKLLSMDEIKQLFPRNIKFLWSRTPYKYDKSGRLFELHAIKISNLTGHQVLDGKSIVSSNAITNRNGLEVSLNLKMNSEGSHIWSRMTRENVDRCIAVSLDGEVITYPRVMDEITGGNTEITGSFTLPEAKYLAAVLSSGGMLMPFKLKISDLKSEKIKK